MDPDEAQQRPDFSSLPAAHPSEKLVLEAPPLAGRSANDYTNRIIDLIAPLGKGQRTLIVAPARAGKTMLLQSILHGVATNYPEALLLVLLVDERPEEVTEMQMIGYGEVIASSFDFPAERHVAIAEMTLEMARRRVEAGQDVVLVLDSLTRLARAYNTAERGTGRTLSAPLAACPNALAVAASRSSPQLSPRPAVAGTRSSSRSSRGPATPKSFLTARSPKNGSSPP
jgi:transcription termination factor Rho